MYFLLPLKSSAGNWARIVELISFLTRFHSKISTLWGNVMLLPLIEHVWYFLFVSYKLGSVKIEEEGPCNYPVWVVVGAIVNSEEDKSLSMCSMYQFISVWYGTGSVVESKKTSKLGEKTSVVEHMLLNEGDLEFYSWQYLPIWLGKTFVWNCGELLPVSAHRSKVWVNINKAYEAALYLEGFLFSGRVYTFACQRFNLCISRCQVLELEGTL